MTVVTLGDLAWVALLAALPSVVFATDVRVVLTRFAPTGYATMVLVAFDALVTILGTLALEIRAFGSSPRLRRLRPT